jgi:type IV secretory pathway VirB9-like protein
MRRLRRKRIWVYKETKNQAVDKQAKKEAVATRDKAINLATQVRDKVNRKSG